jgi:ATP-binding protein involved in chromosome partitioning
MSYLELPTGERMDIFGTGGGEKMAGEAGVEFLGGIPMDPAVREGGDSGKPIVVEQPDSAVTAALQEIAIKTTLRASKLALSSETQKLSITLD